MIDGVSSYEVDITQRARYSRDGVKVSDGQRISWPHLQRPARGPGPEVLRGDQQLPRQPWQRPTSGIDGSNIVA